MIRGYEGSHEGGLPMLRAAVASLLLVATLAGTVVAEPIDDVDGPHGSAGYSATGHLPRLHQDADQGSPLAQYVLGALYQLGEVVPQDHGEAVKWLRRAADQGLAVAQFVLGEVYAFGQGVPEDMVRAYMWLDLAGAQAAQIAGAQKLARDAQELRDTLARKMTPTQIAEARHLAQEWKPKPER
jgi:TPR repeat protein